MKAPWTTSWPRSWSERQGKVPRSDTDGVKVRLLVEYMGPTNSSRPSPVWQVLSSRIFYVSAVAHVTKFVGTQ